MERATLSDMYRDEWRSASPIERLTWRPSGTLGEEDVDEVVAKRSSDEAESQLTRGPQFDVTANAATFVVFTHSAEFPREIREGDRLRDSDGMWYRVLSVRQVRYGTQQVCPCQALEVDESDG